MPVMRRAAQLTRLSLLLTAALGAALCMAPAHGQDQPLPGMAERVAACTACHGPQGRAAPEGYYPRIAGKPEGYLLHQLQNFRDGRRRYPMMNYLLTNLSDDYLRHMARYFAEQHPPYPAPVPATTSAVVLDHGRLLVTQGLQAGPRQIPACATCHGTALAGVQPGIPGLLGLPRDYIIAQLGAWKNGVRQAHAPDCMAHIAQQLTPQDIEAVSSWLSLQPVPPEAWPADTPSTPLPLACGSVRATAGTP